MVESDYDGSRLPERKYITLLKPADNPTLQNVINGMIEAAVLAERERCAKIADEWEMRETGKPPSGYGLGAEIRKGK